MMWAERQFVRTSGTYSAGPVAESRMMQPATPIWEISPMTDRKSFHYVELGVESIERASTFYQRVFGWTFEAPPPEHGATDVVYYEGVPEVGLRLRGRSVPDGGVRPAVAVDSIDQTLAAVEEAGGR